MMTTKLILTWLMLSVSIFGWTQNVITIGSDFQTSTYSNLEQVDVSTLQFPIGNNINIYEIAFINTTNHTQNITISVDDPLMNFLVISYFHPVKGWEIVTKGRNNKDSNSKSNIISSHNLSLGVAYYPQKFRVSVGDGLRLNNMELRVSSSKHFSQTISTRMYLLGVFYGLFLIIIIYSLFSYFSLRNGYFLWFSFFVLFIGIKASIKTGIFTYFISIPSSQLVFEISSIVTTLVFLSVIRFLQLLANYKIEHPKLNQILIAIIGFRILVNILFIAFPELGLEGLLIFSRLGLLLALITGVYVTFQFKYGQKWFKASIIVASSIFILIGTLGTLLDLQIVNFNFFNLNIWLVACITQVLLFLIAITIKINGLANERIALDKKIREAKKALIQAYVNGVKTEKEHVYRDLQYLVLDEFKVLKAKVKKESTKAELEKIEMDIRTISDEMAPEQTNAFIKEITTLINEHSNNQLKINFKNFDCKNQISGDVKKHLIRIIQESLQNIEKHAKASTVDIHLFQEKNQVVLSIKDNGVGFDPSTNANGIGLINMRDRVASIKGKITIMTSPGNGMSIYIETPTNK